MPLGVGHACVVCPGGNGQMISQEVALRLNDFLRWLQEEAAKEGVTPHDRTMLRHIAARMQTMVRDRERCLIAEQRRLAQETKQNERGAKVI
jgi:hypothetical protein